MPTLHSRISDVLTVVKALHKEAVADADNDATAELIASAMTDALTGLETAVALGRSKQSERKE